MSARATDAEKRGDAAPEGRASLPIAPENLAKLADMMAEGRVNSSTGKKIVAALFRQDQDPQAYAAAHDLFTVGDDSALLDAVRQAIAENPAMVESYRGGKLTVEKALMGKAMAITRGKADPERLAELLHMALASV